MSPATFYYPLDDGNYVALTVKARIEQAGRGEFPDAGVLPPGGATTLTVPASLGVENGWYVVVGGQQFRVEGIAPIPPLFRRVELECVRNTDSVRVADRLTLAGDRLSLNGDRLYLGGESRRLGT